ncbi:tetratricopeptide repeat protein, partial [Candidatus Margulisiibacteriota bacterium]
DVLFASGAFKGNFDLVRARLSAKDPDSKKEKLDKYREDCLALLSKVSDPYKIYQILVEIVNIYARQNDDEKVERLYFILKTGGELPDNSDAVEVKFSRFVKKAKAKIEKYGKEVYMAYERQYQERYLEILNAQDKIEQVLAEAISIFSEDLEGKADSLRAQFAYRVGGKYLLLAYNKLGDDNAVKEIGEILLYGKQPEGSVLPKGLSKKLAKYYEYLKKQGLFEEVPALKKELRLHYTHALAWNDLDRQAALEIYDEIISENRFDIDMHVEKAYLYLYEKEYTRARITLEGAEKIDPNNMKVKRALLEVYVHILAATDQVEVLREMVKIIEGNPYVGDADIVTVANSLAEYYVKEGRYTQAHLLMRKVCDNVNIPRYNDGLLWDDITAFMKGRSISVYQGLKAPCYKTWGMALIKMGRYDEGIEKLKYYQKYRQGPPDIQVDLFIAEAELKSGNKQKAQELINRILLRKKIEPYAYVEAIRLYVKLNPNMVREIFEAALAKASKQPSGGYKAGLNSQDKIIQTVLANSKKLCVSKELEGDLHSAYGEFLSGDAKIREISYSISLGI